MSARRGSSNRSFGLSVGGVLCAIAALLVWRRRLMSAEILGAIGFTLVLLGAVRPSLLKWPSFWWFRVARPKTLPIA